jgi:hypothetical protein
MEHIFVPDTLFRKTYGFIKVMAYFKLSRTACYLLRAGFLLGLIFDPKDGVYMFFRNVGWLLMFCTALNPRR